MGEAAGETDSFTRWPPVLLQLAVKMSGLGFNLGRVVIQPEGPRWASNLNERAGQVVGTNPPMRIRT